MCPDSVIALEFQALDRPARKPVPIWQMSNYLHNPL